MRSVVVGAIVVLLMVTAAACGGDGDTAADEPATTAADSSATSEDGDASTDDAGADVNTDDAGADASTDDAGAEDQPSESAVSAGAGTLTLGDDVIELDRARCFLQEQDVSGSPGKILFTAQGFGTTADAEQFVLDVSRYDEDSLFTGDDIQVDVGDPFGDDFYSWDGSAELGAIERDGSTLRAAGLTFRHSEDGSERMGSFQISC